MKSLASLHVLALSSKLTVRNCTDNAPGKLVYQYSTISNPRYISIWQYINTVIKYCVIRGGGGNQNLRGRNMLPGYICMEKI